MKTAARKARKKTKTKRSRSRDGCDMKVELREQSGKAIDRIKTRVAIPALIQSDQNGSRRAGMRRKVGDSVTDAFSALGHPMRARMLVSLLGGPATYQAIQKTTRLAAGPLYHHINQIRLAGLILPRQRDLYELTRAGRNMAMLLLAAGPLLKDRRRRPLS